MIRRSFRVGLWLGLLFGIAFAVVKLAQSRRDERALAGTSPDWEPPRAAEEKAAVRDAPAVKRAVAAVEAPPRRSRPVKAVPAPPPSADPAPAAGRRATGRRPPRAWVEPTEGACPSSHPVKAKLTSRLFHLPGMLAYDRTNADRCYASAEAAEADGLSRAKR